MMVFKLRPIMLGLIAVVCLGISLLWAAEISVPLPADAVKIAEKIMDKGPLKSTVETYQSYFAPNKINAFYKKEMPRAGWAQNKGGLSFVKNGYLAVISCGTSKDEAGAVQFMIITTKIPDPDQILAARKTTPDKVNFMPIYPGCMQNFLYDTPTGISGSYETESGIQEVIFFYKSGMLNYGWSLYSEIPLKEEIVKVPESIKSNTPVTSSSATLRFHRKAGESCVIMIRSVSGMEEYLLPGEQLVDEKSAKLVPKKTTILVVYNEQKRINQ
jgi:hypothetical protein